MRDTSFVVSPSPIMLFLRSRFSSESSATSSFKSRISWRKPLTSPEAAWRPVSPARRFLPASRNSSTSCNTDPRQCPHGDTKRRCSPPRVDPTPRSGSSPQQNTACVSCGEYPVPFSPQGRSSSLISVPSSLPSVTTMNQKSSLMKSTQSLQ